MFEEEKGKSKNLGALEFYDALYKTDFKCAEETYYDFISELISNVRGKRVLDVGFGRGEILLRVHNKGGFPYGVEISERAIDICKKVIPAATLVLSPAESLPFRDNFFHMAICSGTLEHFIGPAEALSEIWRVLKPSGTLCVVIPNRCWLGNIPKVLLFPLYALAKVGNRKSGIASRQPIEREYSFRFGKTFLEKSGFTIVKWMPYQRDVVLYQRKYFSINKRILSPTRVPASLCHHHIFVCRKGKKLERIEDA